jgi:hypothetical protein
MVGFGENCDVSYGGNGSGEKPVFDICLMSTEFPWNYHKDFPIVINRNSLVSSSTCMAGGLAKHLLPQAEGQLQPLSLVLPWQARVAA